MAIDEVTDIYVHADQLRKTVADYLARAGEQAGSLG
jgi:predicted type IV restriction endonuclease